jgi:hypothetical protein
VKIKITKSFSNGRDMGKNMAQPSSLFKAHQSLTKTIPVTPILAHLVLSRSLKIW